jgi:DNA polymerase III subunit alpha
VTDFVHLHRHSEYSLLDGLGTAQHYSTEAARKGMEALAITDHGTMAGVLHHIDACSGIHLVDGANEKVHDPIKPIVGIEAYFRPDAKRHDAENKEYYHLVLLAKDLTGFRSLLRLSSESWREENFYYKPCVDWEMLEREHEGLIASTSCLSGYLPQMMLVERPDEANRYMKRMREIFKDDLYFEVQPHNFDEQRQCNVELINMAQALGVPFVATVDAHYPYHEWHTTHDVLVMINTGQSLESRKRKDEAGEDYMAFSGDTFYLMDHQELSGAFAQHHPNVPKALVEEAIKSSLDIAAKCEAYVPSRHPKIPKASTSLMQAEAIVAEWCEEGLERIGREGDEKYRAQLEHELAVMRDKRVFDYFVILGDVVRWCKSTTPMPERGPDGVLRVGAGHKRPIRVGAGRGSAAGSLVSYLVGITAIDPIGHGLLFERFLNPSRSDYPDIDIDFQHNRRKEVKEYLAVRWGRDHVADIAAFQRFGMRAALQNACRVFDVPYEEVMAVSRSMDDGTGEMDLVKMRAVSEELEAFAQKYPEPWEHAVRLEGQVKAASKHAAGVVITDLPISDYMPTMKSNDGTVQTQWSERAEFPIISMWGFLKMDILGTDGLTVQDTALEMIEQRTGQRIDFEDPKQFPVIEDMDAAEQEVVESFGHGGNLGVFQFESRGINGLLRDIRPTHYIDIVAANALFRPGPLEGGMAFDYAKRKNGELPIVYWHEAVIPFLEKTYGIMVFQEQIMQIVQALGGFSLGEADTVRKAMTKWQSTKIKSNKGRQEMEQLRDKFVEGCQDRGIEVKLAKSIWEMILQFSIYGFNQSHSDGYALQGYQDKWLKWHHPLEFYASLMTWEPAKVPHIIRESQARGVKILPPDVNDSQPGFALVGNAIRFGFEAIKHVGDAAVDELMQKRPFESYEDIEERCVLRKLNSRVRTALLECGAFDRWGMRKDWTDVQKAEAEKRLLGFALATGAAITKYKSIIEAKVPAEHEWDEMGEGVDAMVGGEITNVKEIVTKKGDPMAFVELAFESNEYSATFFPNTYQRYRHLLATGNAIICKGARDAERGCMRVEACVQLEDLYQAMKEQEKEAA